MRKLVPSTAFAVAAILALAVSAALAIPGSVVSVNPSPVAACQTPALGTNYVNSEVEPFVAANPAVPGNLIAVWQQDRWSSGGSHALMSAASFNGGGTWGAQQVLPFDSCAPGGLPYDRATDPWVSVGPDGTAYAVSDSFNALNNDNAIVAIRSTNGGVSWDHRTLLLQNNDQNQFFNDKESVTADPTRPGYAYAVWDQLVGPVDNPSVLAHNFSSFTGPTYFARTTNGGVSWEPARIILPMRQRQQSIGNVILVAPNGTLYDFFDLITATGPNGQNTSVPHGFTVAYMKSSDAGLTWSDPFVVQQIDAVTATDPNTGAPLRTADILPSQAIDPVTGKLYVVWQDARNTHDNGKNHNAEFPEIFESHSLGDDQHWSDPVVVSNSGSPAVDPAIAVSPTGRVGITYYDFTDLAPDNTTTLPTDMWFTTNFGATRSKVTGPFNFLMAPNAGGFFLGDYQGLVASGTGFVAVNDITNCNDTSCSANPTDTYAFTLP